jgi:hypothetical protein
MWYMRLFAVEILWICLFLSSGCLSQRGEVKEVWETTNNTLKIRITVYEEKSLFPLSGRYYVLQSSLQNSDKWHEVMTVFTKDLVLIPRENLRFVDDQIAFFFMKQKYAISTDGGHTWSVWDASKEYDNYAFIKEVRIESDGKGVITFHDVPSQQRELVELHTSDYGRHWNTK